VLVAAALSACRNQPPPRIDREVRAEDLLHCDDPREAIAEFRRVAEESDRPEVKARAQLGIARCYLKLGNYRKALDSLYAARTLCDLGPQKEVYDRLFAEAAFKNRDFGIARDYLERTLPLTRGEERAIVLAELSVCAKRGQDARAAERYLAEIPRPYSPDVRGIFRDFLEHSEPASAPTPPAVARPTPHVPAPSLPAGPLAVLPRGYWGARPVFVSRVDPMGKISRITVHHTGGPTFWGHSAAESANEIRKIQRVHQSEKQWADIGYHYIIDRVGRVWQGRPLVYQGAHAKGDANRGNIGVVILGNYMQQDLNTAQLRALRNVVGWLCDRFQIPPQRVYTHCEIRHGTTECPGPPISRAVEDIRRSLPAIHTAD
jgi:tetratricopeptide (TPR) repeat protein